MDFETLEVRKEAAVLVAEIAAPPMNLLGPALVRDLVSLSKPRPPTTLLGCSCSRAPIPTISCPTSTRRGSVHTGKRRRLRLIPNVLAIRCLRNLAV
jgi:hypothetical protein